MKNDYPIDSNFLQKKLNFLFLPTKIQISFHICNIPAIDFCYKINRNSHRVLQRGGCNIQVLQVLSCLEGNTMSNRGAYSTKERMPSDRTYRHLYQPGGLYLIDVYL